jgi:hypothetical protein
MWGPANVMHLCHVMSCVRYVRYGAMAKKSVVLRGMWGCLYCCQGAGRGGPRAVSRGPSCGSTSGSMDVRFGSGAGCRDCCVRVVVDLGVLRSTRQFGQAWAHGVVACVAVYLSLCPCSGRLFCRSPPPQPHTALSHTERQGGAVSCKLKARADGRGGGGQRHGAEGPDEFVSGRVAE